MLRCMGPVSRWTVAAVVSWSATDRTGDRQANDPRSQHQIRPPIDHQIRKIDEACTVSLQEPPPF